MIQLYPHAPDSPSVGSPAYAQTLLRVYRQYDLSGLLEIQNPTEPLVLLMFEGNLVAAYRETSAAYREFSTSEVFAHWKAGEATVRSINLPHEAVRLAQCILEWFAPTTSIHLNSDTIRDYLEVCRIQLTSGLLQFSWPQADACLVLLDGSPLPSESIFSSSSGVEVGAPVLENVLNRMSSPCAVSRFEARPTSTSFQILLLRTAIQNWVPAMLARYSWFMRHGPGDGLVASLNQVLYRESYFFHVNENALTDSHFFPTAQAARRAYTHLLMILSQRIEAALGQNLARKIWTETLEALEWRDQNTLQQHGLVAAAALH